MGLPRRQMRDSNSLARKFNKLSGTMPGNTSQLGRRRPPIPAPPSEAANKFTGQANQPN